MRDPLVVEVAAAAAALGLVPGTRVLVAASGGADSTALAALLAAAANADLPLALTLGHVDHGWRGTAEAEADRACVSALGARLHIPVLVAGPPASIRRTEEAARAHRYAALTRLAREAQCDVIATAHHRRDVAETYLLRLARGSGLQGLASIPARRRLPPDATELTTSDGTARTRFVVRPALDVAVERLRAFAVSEGLPFRDDPTNADRAHDRNRLRAHLREATARGLTVEADAVHAARVCRTRWTTAATSVARLLAPTLRVHRDAGAVEVSLADVRRVPHAALALVLTHLADALPHAPAGPWFTRRHVALCAEIATGQGPHRAVDLPQGLGWQRTRDRLWLVRREPPPQAPVPLCGVGVVRHGTLSIDRRDVSAAEYARTRSAPVSQRTRGPAPRPAGAVLDAAVAGPRVTVRRVAPHDRFVPLHHTRAVRVSEFLARAGVPRPLRQTARVVTDADDHVLWVIGHRIDARAAVNTTTRTVACFEATYAEDPQDRVGDDPSDDAEDDAADQTDVSSIADFFAGGVAGAGEAGPSSTEREVVAVGSLRPFLNSLMP